MTQLQAPLAMLEPRQSSSLRPASFCVPPDKLRSLSKADIVYQDSNPEVDPTLHSELLEVFLCDCQGNAKTDLRSP